MILLVANKLTISDHDMYDHLGCDNEMIDDTLGYLRCAATKPVSKHLWALHDANFELNRRVEVSAMWFLLDQNQNTQLAPILSEERNHQIIAYLHIGFTQRLYKASFKPLEHKVLQVNI